jgi:hypothetical protein
VEPEGAARRLPPVVRPRRRRFAPTRLLLNCSRVLRMKG